MSPIKYYKEKKHRRLPGMIPISLKMCAYLYWQEIHQICMTFKNYFLYVPNFLKQTCVSFTVIKKSTDDW
jgi:hypothetical protein